MNLYQNTDKYICHVYKDREEWKSKRIKGIGGSDASTLIGMNHWKDNSTLWKEKKGLIVPEDISSKPNVAYGTNAEPFLRGLFALDFPQYEAQYLDNVTLQSKEYPWLLYSPDGLLYERSTGRKGILEIKTTSILQSMQREKWKGKIPDNYFIQVMHGLLVTGFDFVILKAQLKTQWGNEISDVELHTKHYYFTRDEKEEDLLWLLDMEKGQWEKYYVGDLEPPTKLPKL